MYHSPNSVAKLQGVGLVDKEAIVMGPCGLFGCMYLSLNMDVEVLKSKFWVERWRYLGYLRSMALIMGIVSVEVVVFVLRKFLWRVLLSLFL
jgi:hypothetical protein